MLRGLGAHLPIELRNRVRVVRSNVARAKLWQWEVRTSRGGPFDPFELLYVGRSPWFGAVCDVLGLPERRGEDAAPSTLGVLRSGVGFVATEAPVPGWLQVPTSLRTFVPLDDRSPGAELAAYASELRRQVRRLVERSETRAITADAEIARVHREMLVPYAQARHGDRANVIPLEEIAALVRQGRLELVMLDGEPVGTFLGFEYRRGGSRVFAAVRFGHPPHVCADPHRLEDANILTAHCALVHARRAGCDTFDFGLSPACPDGGNLRFKRRRGGALSSWGCGPRLSARLPDEQVATFLWRFPLFTIERDAVVLNVGVPASATDGDVVARLREVAFCGLEAVRLHAERDASPALLAAVSAVYDRAGTGAVHGHGGARRVEVLRH